MSDLFEFLRMFSGLLFFIMGSIAIALSAGIISTIVLTGSVKFSNILPNYAVILLLIMGTAVAALITVLLNYFNVYIDNLAGRDYK